MRCFVAIDLEAGLKSEIGQAIASLKKGDWDVGWVRPENLHLTLRFLGETAEGAVDRLKEELSMGAARCRPFDMSLDGTGVFPDSRRPRVIWIDISEQSGHLRKLQELIEVSCETLGYNEERRNFSPHLTVGRIRSQKGKETLLEEIDKFKDKHFGNIHVDKFALMKSDLRPTGAQYSTLAEFRLNEEGE